MSRSLHTAVDAAIGTAYQQSSNAGKRTTVLDHQCHLPAACNSLCPPDSCFVFLRDKPAEQQPPVVTYRCVHNPGSLCTQVLTKRRPRLRTCSCSAYCTASAVWPSSGAHVSSHRVNGRFNCLTVHSHLSLI